MKGEELLRPGRRVKFVALNARGAVIRESRAIVVKSHVSSGNEVRVIDAANGVHTLKEWDITSRSSPWMIVEADDDDEAQAQQAKQPRAASGEERHASLDEQVNSHIDDLLSRDFSAERFASELRGLSRRATQVIEIEKTVLRMGLKRLPDDQRDAVRKALRASGDDPDKTHHETDAEVQAPRAGRAGPST